MTGLYVLIGVLLLMVGLLVFMRRDLRSAATSKDDLAEALAAAKLQKAAEEAEAEARKRDEELR